VIDVVSDANIALKWFHEAGEEEVEESRSLLDAYKDRLIDLWVLDLTPYEVGNALLRGRVGAGPQQVATVLASLEDICPVVSPVRAEMQRAVEIASKNKLTLYDAAYAAVAENREAVLVTLDRALLKAGLGKKPSRFIKELPTSNPTHQSRFEDEMVITREAHEGAQEAIVLAIQHYRSGSRVTLALADGSELWAQLTSPKLRELQLREGQLIYLRASES
jgi:predicted nucleic acid-binding protein